MKPALSIIVPCYNEEKNISLIVNRYLNTNIDDNTELVLVDNGSKDQSWQLMNKFSRKHPNVSIVQVKKNIGYGYGIWKGLNYAKGDFLCWTHADMQTDVKDCFEAYKILQDHKNKKQIFVKGRRISRPIVDSLFTLGMSIFESIILKTVLTDINAQPNLFHKKLLSNIKSPPKDFSFDLYFYYSARKLGYKIIRFPVKFEKRIHGKSHWNTSLKGKYKFIKRTVKYSLNLRKKLKNEADSS